LRKKELSSSRGKQNTILNFSLIQKFKIKRQNSFFSKNSFFELLLEINFAGDCLRSPDDKKGAKEVNAYGRSSTQ